MIDSFVEEKRKAYKTERKSNLEPVNAVIEALKKELGLDESFFVIAKVWENEIGAQDVQISGFKDGTIYAQTQYNASQHDIMIRKKEIIKKLNQYTGSSKIKNIKIEIKE
jgi:hypothetical protein